jgi:hypothetical protein
MRIGNELSRIPGARLQGPLAPRPAAEVEKLQRLRESIRVAGKSIAQIGNKKKPCVKKRSSHSNG